MKKILTRFFDSC